MAWMIEGEGEEDQTPEVPYEPTEADQEIIRLVEEGDHNIDCKIDGFGAMALKSEFVKKA